MMSIVGFGHEPKRNIRYIYIHNGNEYIVVKDWSENELLGYREVANGHIEIILSFAGIVELTKVHPAFMKLVLDFRGEQINGDQGNYQGR